MDLAKENVSIKDQSIEEMTITTPDYSDPKAKRKLAMVIAT